MYQTEKMMIKYKDKATGKRIVEVKDLSYLSDRNHPYNWLQRHFHHHRLRISLKKADIVIAYNETVATDLVRYYFLSKDKIVLKS